jgi:hypothetical protein
MANRVPDNVWTAVWDDFLSNRVAQAERRAAPYLHSLPVKLEAASSAVRSLSHTDAEQFVMLADLAHVAGAFRDDETTLRLALAAYDIHLKAVPENLAAMRMRAETLLRCRDNEVAFAAFDELHKASQAAGAPEDTEIAPFQLLHDADAVETAVRLGADGDSQRFVAGWRELASELTSQASGDATSRTAVSALTPQQRALLSGGATSSPAAASSGVRRDLPLPPAPVRPATALRADIDWVAAQDDYTSKQLVVIDSILDPAALAYLQHYSRHGANFQTMRKGYLGAFPGDGTVDPLLLSLSCELAAAAPAIFANHALALWWLFKYDQTNPSGIGIHADPAAVNLNLWLTDDSARLQGGGLAIYSHVPELEQKTQAVNKEFGTGAEEELRRSLTDRGEVHTIEYACNRAAIFVSDQYVFMFFASAFRLRMTHLRLNSASLIITTGTTNRSPSCFDRGTRTGGATSRSCLEIDGQ